MNDKKNINFSTKKILIVVIMLIIVVIGGTFAWFTYRSKESALVLTIGNIDDVQITLKPYQVVGSMTPVSTYTSGVYSEVEVVNNGDDNSSVSLYYKINKLDEELIDNGLKYTITSSTSKNGTYSVVKTGNFTSVKGESEVVIYEFETTSNSTQYLKVYLWVDSSVGNQNAIQGATLDVGLNGSILRLNNEPAVPVLDPGMIPVTIANNGTVTTVSETDSSWYNYDNKQWANAVLVNSTSRSNYQGTTGITITQSDILGYYVWIPRYKYKIWLKDGTITSSPQEIDIIFEDKNTVTTGSEVGDYMTHPAFIFGGENLSGIWVGKFETTGDATTPTILPNVSSLRSQYISAQFATSLKFAGGTQSGSNVTFAGNNTYGLISTTDSHMMKNSEWGAVAYLSHSQYGINSEIRINNNSNYTTGCGASEENGDGTSECQIAYGSGVTSYPQSTTGNITGIFDMSGGAFEYVMGNYGNVAGYSGFNTFPESKYYDLYSSSQFTGDYETNILFCTLDSCGGHALNETADWYGDYAYFVGSEEPWFIHGGSYGDGSGAGAFGADYFDGDANKVGSWRSVLVVDGV